MLKIRLTKRGAKNALFYRIVAIDQQKKAKGKYVDLIGWWNPTKGTKSIDKKKVEMWQKNGAQISSAVKKLMNL